MDSIAKTVITELLEATPDFVEACQSDDSYSAVNVEQYIGVNRLEDKLLAAGYKFPMNPEEYGSDSFFNFNDAIMFDLVTDLIFEV